MIENNLVRLEISYEVPSRLNARVRKRKVRKFVLLILQEISPGVLQKNQKF